MNQKPHQRPQPKAHAVASKSAKPAARKLFEPTSRPLDAAVTPLVSVRRPRRRRSLLGLALLGFAQLLVFGADPAGAESTNQAAASSSLVPTNPAATENRPSTEDAADTAPKPQPVPAQPAPGATSSPAPAVSASPGRDTRPAAPGGRSAQDRNRDRSARAATADFSAFRIVSERNIFDPNRAPRRPGNTPRPRPRTVDSFSLVGIMEYEKGIFAFFDGSSSQYRKALKPSDSIAGFKIAAISGNTVKLVSSKKEVELQVGMQLRREEEGEWQSSRRTETYASNPSSGAPTASSAPAPSSSAPPAASSSGGGGSADEVLRRLMQRREQE